MRIDFEFSGGYAYIMAKYHANTDKLPKDVAGKLLRLVESSGIFDLKQSVVATSAGPPDVFFYKLSLYEDGRSISLSFNDVTIPATVHPLLAFLRKLALEQTQKDRL